jgi:hypothetical protein
MAVGDSSHLERFRPRPAALAATTQAQKHQQQVDRIAKQHSRRKLPRTQWAYYQQMLASR